MKMILLLVYKITLHLFLRTTQLQPLKNSPFGCGFQVQRRSKSDVFIVVEIVYLIRIKPFNSKKKSKFRIQT
jgi:hypothetical protein